MSIKVGPVELPNNVILAPMSGVTDLPFRRIVKKFGSGLLVSEMIASEAMIRSCRRMWKKMSGRFEGDYPMSVQLAGCKAESMAEAAKLNEDQGAAIIDINMGCPAKKVVNGYSGSALMKDLEHAKSLITATVQAVKVPVTLKMRTGWDYDCRNAPELAKIAEGEGIQLITVHGRTRNQFYKGSADWAFINEVKKNCNLPLIVNGDIVDAETIDQSMAMSGADGVMIGRATYGKPWLISQAVTYMETGIWPDEPSLDLQLEAIIEHYDDMLDHYGPETAVKMARKHLGWYTKGLPSSADFRNEVNRIPNPDDVKQAVKDFYAPLIEQEAA